MDSLTKNSTFVELKYIGNAKHKQTQNKMSIIKNLYSKEAIEKLKSLVDEIKICLFCTILKTDDCFSYRLLLKIEI